MRFRATNIQFRVGAAALALAASLAAAGAGAGDQGLVVQGAGGRGTARVVDPPPPPTG